MIGSDRLTQLMDASRDALVVVQAIEKAQGQSWNEVVREGAYERPVVSEFAEALDKFRSACESERVEVQVVRDFLVEARVAHALLQFLEQRLGKSPFIPGENGIVFEPINDLRRAIYRTERELEGLSS